jgi:hypothetical protein
MTEYKAKFSCDRCEFHGKDTHALKTHETSKKHHAMLDGIVKKEKKVKDVKLTNCSDCGFYGLRSYDLQRHLLTKKHIYRNNAQPEKKELYIMTCPVCKYNTTDRSNLRKHVHNIHSEDFDVGKLEQELHMIRQFFNKAQAKQKEKDMDRHKEDYLRVKALIEKAKTSNLQEVLDAELAKNYTSQHGPPPA